MDFYRNNAADCYIPDVPLIPAFGKGQECSFGAVLTAALQAMKVETDYEHVMGVSGACYRLAFCSPGWDYSSVDGLVAYDYATWAYQAFGYSVEFVNRVVKEERADVRKRFLNESKSNRPVLGINLRVAPEWGVICGYKDNGDSLFCRTKYDEEILESAKYERGLHIFVDCNAREKNGGYSMGAKAYETWSNDLLDDSWYESQDEEQIKRDWGDSYAPRNCSVLITVGGTIDEYRADSWPVNADSEFAVRSRHSFYKKTDQSKKEEQKALLEEYLLNAQISKRMKKEMAEKTNLNQIR